MSELVKRLRDAEERVRASIGHVMTPDDVTDYGLAADEIERLAEERRVTKVAAAAAIRAIRTSENIGELSDAIREAVAVEMGCNTEALDAALARIRTMEPVVAAACRVVAADTYKHPVLSRQEAVAAGVAELHDAVGKYESASWAASVEVRGVE